MSIQYIGIKIGALAPPITEQLKELNLPDDKLAQLHPFDLDAKAITRLYVRGIIIDTECDKVGKRLAKKIAEALNETS